MSRINELHEQAMELADQAFLAKRRGELERSVELAYRAFKLESTAAEMVRHDVAAEPTRSILYRSAASLAIDCGETEAAIHLVATGLSGEPPPEIADELRDLLQQVQNHEAEDRQQQDVQSLEQRVKDVIDRQELEAFEAQVQAEEALRHLLDEATTGVATEVELVSPTRVDPVMGLWIVGLAGLWLLSKVGINHLRGMSETAALAKQVEVISRLKELGYDETQSAQVVENLLKGLRTRPDDDSVLKTLQKLIAS